MHHEDTNRRDFHPSQATQLIHRSIACELSFFSTTANDRQHTKQQLYTDWGPTLIPTHLRNYKYPVVKQQAQEEMKRNISDEDKTRRRARRTRPKGLELGTTLTVTEQYDAHLVEALDCSFDCLPFFLRPRTVSLATDQGPPKAERETDSSEDAVPGDSNSDPHKASTSSSSAEGDTRSSSRSGTFPNPTNFAERVMHILENRIAPSAIWWVDGQVIALHPDAAKNTGLLTTHFHANRFSTFVRTFVRWYVVWRSFCVCMAGGKARGCPLN